MTYRNEMMKCPETRLNEMSSTGTDGFKKRDEDDDEQGRHTWGTWEELLLACAVKRHGFSDWDSVAMEVQTRSSLPQTYTTAINCKQKYRDLKRRFREQTRSDNDDDDEDYDEDEERDNQGNDGDGDDKIDTVPWLEQLLSLRVTELKRELQRFDVSIPSLQLKVKRLEEERDQKTDRRKEISEDGKTESKRPKSEKPVTEEDSDRENLSVNESNSTGVGDKTEAGPGQFRRHSMDPDPVRNGEGAVSDGSDLSESGGSGGESGTRLSGGEVRGVAPDPDVGVKSQPLIGLLDLIRSHRNGSLFERRLQIQESDDYKNIVLQHLDLETIQTKLNQGSYTSSRLAFYRDLLLLLTNAVVFFPKSSTESVAANQLQTLVLTEMRKETRFADSNLQDVLAPKSEPEISDSWLARHKPSAPVLDRKNPNSIPTEPSSSTSFTQKREQEKKPEQALKEEEMPATGTRSSRRNNKRSKITPTNKEQTGTVTKLESSDDRKQVTPKTEIKKAKSTDKKKSMADFLKRIKKNSPVKTSSKKGGKSNKEEKIKNGAGKSENKGQERVLRSTAEKKKAKEEDSSLPRKSMGRQAKKGVEAAAAMGKRGRENGGGGKQKHPVKRARR